MEQKGQKIRAENEQITNHPFQIENEKFLFFFLSLEKRSSEISKRRLLLPNASYSITLRNEREEKNQKKEKTQPLSIDPQAS